MVLSKIITNNLSLTVLQHTFDKSRSLISTSIINKRHTNSLHNKLENNNKIKNINKKNQNDKGIPVYNFTISKVSHPSIQNIPVVKKWLSAIYNYNQTWLKSLPVADNSINKLIKRFFAMRPLILNKVKIKTRLSIRRFFKLSLNQIFTSNAEIKHTSDTAYVTVFAHNKKKLNLIFASNKIWEKYFKHKAKNIKAKSKQNKHNSKNMKPSFKQNKSQYIS